jgi:alkaline phosphatase
MAVTVPARGLQTTAGRRSCLLPSSHRAFGTLGQELATSRPSIALAIALVIALAGCARPAVPSHMGAPRGIVLVIGDGMGAAHITLAKLLRGNQFQIGRMRQVGLVATRSTSSLVTDSAAAATAYATGIATANGVIGMDPDHVAHQTVLELAEARGLATGLVTTALLADATPAAFAAHDPDRAHLRAIAGQMVTSGADLLVGTGLEAFGVELPPLEELAAKGGYRAVRTASAMQAAPEGPVLAALRSGELDGADSPDARLSMVTAWALDRLARNAEGFFLMVEHEGIDTASHHGASALLEASVRSLDETVGVVLDVAERRGDVLVVVVGDHECGGLQIQGTPGEPQLVWTTDHHTGEAVPLFATGPGAAAFTGSLDNVDVGRALLAAVGSMGTSSAVRVVEGPRN